MEEKRAPSREAVDPAQRVVAVVLLGTFSAAVCLIFVAVLLFFQPGQFSFTDRYFPSATSTFAPTRTRTPSPVPTGTPNTTATQRLLNVTNTARAFGSTATQAASEWRLVLADDFASERNGWGTEASDDERAKSLIEVKDGKYVWDISTHKLAITWETADTTSLGDFTLAVDAKQIGGPTNAEYGVIFREDVDYDFYYFAINNLGQYTLLLWYDDWITLINYTRSELIHPNQSNRIGVIAHGSHFIFSINGERLVEYTSDRIKTGKVGLIGALFRSNEQAVFEFDNFEVRAP